jgi:uncharacterized OB-fold protein
MLPADPRPRVLDDYVEGSRCIACGAVEAPALTRCRRCWGATVAARFGPGATVWASTVVRVAVGDRHPPYGVAFVDLDADGKVGPRILAHLNDAKSVPPGTRATVCGAANGDVIVKCENGTHR